jgi:hypothetical protein
VLVGHSHVALELAGDATEVRGGQAARARTSLELGRAAAPQPGSVGQPRDSDPRAAWLVIDEDADGQRSAERTIRSS